MIILKEIINKDFHLELFAVQHSFRDNLNINDAFYRCNSFVFMVRFNLFRDSMVLCFRLFLAESSVMFRRLAILEGAGMIKLTSPPLWTLALLTH